MKREKFPDHHENTERNIFLLLMITILILYIAVPIYGVVRDEKQGEAIFRIDDPVTGSGEGLPDKIIDFFFGSREIPVPITQIFDLEGTVIFSDKTPYSNGIVELKSTPRYTRTTKDGYFIFKDVEAGKHTVSVIDEAGSAVAGCSIEISADTSANSHKIINNSHDAYVIRVPVNVELLEIQIVLETGEDGSVQGCSLEVISVDTVQQDQSGIPGEVPELRDGEIPETPASEAIPSGETPGSSTPEGTEGGGGETGGPTPGPFDFSVYDHNVSFGSEAAHINIFGSDKRIAPGERGSYRFTVDNTRNSYSSLYTVAFTVRDTFPAGRKIPMVYRLKAGNSYVAGDENTWCDASELNQDRIIAGNSSVAYTMEWHWREGENDSIYGELGGDADCSYSLRIEVKAQQN